LQNVKRPAITPIPASSACRAAGINFRLAIPSDILFGFDSGGLK
jgi:hypothetical protein